MGRETWNKVMNMTPGESALRDELERRGCKLSTPTHIKLPMLTVPCTDPIYDDCESEDFQSGDDEEWSALEYRPGIGVVIRFAKNDCANPPRKWWLYNRAWQMALALKKVLGGHRQQDKGAAQTLSTMAKRHL